MGEETAIPHGPGKADARKSVLKGIAWAALSSLLISLMHVLVRDVTQEVHPIVVVFFRNVVGFIILIPFLLRQDRTHWKSKQPKLQLIRSIFGVCALSSFFIGLSMVPVADVTAIGFVTVLFITIGASILLREKVGIRRWTAIAVGFVGTLIIVRPGSGIFGPGAFIVLASTVFWAGSMLCVKVLSRTDSSVTMVFYANVYFTAFSLIPAIIFWSWPTWEQFGVMVAIGVLAALGHLALATSLRLADATVVAPVDYTRLLWAAGVGYLMFGEFPDVWTWIGGTVIFLSTVYITYRESRRPKSTPPPPPTPTTQATG